MIRPRIKYGRGPVHRTSTIVFYKINRVPTGGRQRIDDASLLWGLCPVASGLPAQSLQHRRLAQFCQCSGLDLAYTLACNTQFSTDLLKGMCLSVAQTEAKLQD